MTTDSFAVIRKIHAVITDAARHGHTIDYSDAMSEIGWTSANANHRGCFAYYLKAISLIELVEGNPPLTAVVVSKATKRPNKAFFDFARAEQRMRKDDTDETYWQRSLQAVFQRWAPDNATACSFNGVGVGAGSSPTFAATPQ